ncbi:hypothetical protein ASE75_08510 [Sphingomonas sp. Leaf17]|uniref:hypothetical protein n=1 Tax=Sphingomonas sp. Leaf17 TaxID=1735683 RepID=UPI0006FFAA80|nr:hypothetical protein [Sphingomonas sp. Leaf17]KQM65076.1 hypothetical protein ASE75_08510 [Sphingomonas sp. Leaf17]
MSDIDTTAFDSTAAGAADATHDKATKAAQGIRTGAEKIGQQATDKVRAFAEMGKDKAGGTLDQFAQMLTDAAGTVDEKIGAQYGQYARQAADTVSGLADTIRAKDVDALVDDARGYVRASPGVAIGVAAALGFVVARLVQSGLDEKA